MYVLSNAYVLRKTFWSKLITIFIFYLFMIIAFILLFLFLFWNIGCKQFIGRTKPNDLAKLAHKFFQ